MRNLMVIPNIPYEVPQIIDITDSLPKRGSWETIKKKYTVKGHWDGVTYHTGFRKPEDIDTIVIHHSGSPEGTLESHARYHASKWGAGLSYHVAIDGGLIKQTNNLLSFTYHAANHNTYTVAIMVNRDLSKKDLTDRERELLYAAILSVKAVLPIKYIKGHNELCPTACPCTSMNRIRKDIMDLEQEIAYNQTEQKQDEIAFRIANQILYLYNLGKGKDANGRDATPGQMEWAKKSLLKLEPEMRRLGFLK